MNRWSLKLKSKELESEFKMQENLTNKKILKIITFVVLVSSSLQIAVNFMKDNEFRLNVFLYFLIYFIVGSICIIMVYLKQDWFNYAIFFSLSSYMALIFWSNKDAVLKSFFTSDDTITPFIRGFFLAITISTSLIGSNFILKFIFLFLCLFAIIFSASQNPGLDVVKILPTLLAMIYKVYMEDR